MSPATRASRRPRAGPSPGRRSRVEPGYADDAPDEGRELHGPYLRSFRAQPKRRVSPRMIAFLLLAAALLFLKVWERTVSNSLSMERDRLAREVRTLVNRIRITHDLEEQAAFRTGIDPVSLGQLGFQNPEPARVVDVDIVEPRGRHRARVGLAARLLGSVRRALPASLTERVVGLPAAPVEAGVTR
ncbi:MAG: hypothetical protein E6K76_04330 [Candidatus Eisenbacteria bacterium]|uniref:Uncharacterized protein n=1 Tax=Eiseniibacteriota bacterium TaxID=2212470 RepID=A0A538T868_UNCEI|nr:MAG: hypothetical protein E6K76_04330 [Candidatus Eisenbacteria bacterium]